MGPMLSADDLVLCAGTLMDAEFSQLCRAAEAGGFQAITLWPQHVRRARAAGLTPADLRQMLSDSGLEVADLDPLLTWLPDEPVPPGDWAEESEFYAIADVVGARSLNLAQGFGRHVELERAADAFGSVCDRAGEQGLLVTLEYLPWSGIPDAEMAYDIVARADRDNGRILVDTWHSYRGPTDTPQLLDLPGECVGSVQLSDAPAVPTVADPVAETLQDRRLPGEGDAPLAEWLQALDDVGSTAPIGVEVFGRVLDGVDPLEVGRRCGAAARRVLAAARRGESELPRGLHQT